MSTDTPKKRILVIDDNEIILKTTSMKLQSAGYDVITALDGSEGVSLVRTEQPDLVLLDITFPPDVGGVSWDGYRIMDWLNRVDVGKKIPIIVISGVLEDKAKQRAISCGAIGFFPKPVNFDEMIKTIRTALNGSANASASAAA